MKSLAGQLLVASPQLRDPNFAQAVVLLLQHEPQGTLGVVLNRPSDKTVQQVWELIEKDPIDCHQLVHLGGPVPGPLIALHTEQSFSNKEILPGLFVTVQEESFHSLVDQQDAQFRFFSGHAGWGAEQLESELSVGGWLKSPATVEDVFGDHETLWKRATSRIGLSILVPGIGKDRVPDDPSLN